jgi:phage shock protein C
MKRLYRSQKDRKLAGIFGGLGDYFDIDSNVLRLLAVLLFLISGFFPVLITYIIAWVILPDEDQITTTDSTATTTVPGKKQKDSGEGGGQAKKRSTSRKTSPKKTS